MLTVYVFLPGLRIRNFWLLLVSLAFYAWGEVGFIFLLLASTIANYLLGRWMDRSQDPAGRKLAVAVAVVVNVSLLAYFKYANFAVSGINSLLAFWGLAPVAVPHILLPIGISFFTFHALSYVIDVYRRKWKAATDPRDVALYIFFFPQLIAGPILRWSAIGPQLTERTGSLDQLAEGISRFSGGLAKKALVANTLAVPADQIFSLPANELSTSTAWFGIICYSLQIYFDFSGYSDMAIGMGKMFGFTFMENFDFPYISQSIREFWRRWHISLSTWFRDYVYIPLGGNRGSKLRTCGNLLAVFFLCGLWHGASLTFVIWGLYHGCFLALERTSLGKKQAKMPQILRHLYALLVVMMGWVIFRADTLAGAGEFFAALFGCRHPVVAPSYVQYASNPVLAAVGLGILFSGPTWKYLKGAVEKLGLVLPVGWHPAMKISATALEMCLFIVLLLASSAWLASGTYNPFIYFRF
ncbi:MAG TPA: MBOAT family protein [Candidatus Acidoferrum sp.]|nr:MBOAT family protein [Candidatus Acidoferrum sp.]